MTLLTGRNPDCWCTTCNPPDLAVPTSMRMALCPTCGNKRCPRAHNHALACTGSNEPGQPGSSCEHIKPAAAPEVALSAPRRAGKQTALNRELLELAAKAAGLPLGYGDGQYFYCEHGPFGASMYGRKGSAPLSWSPLADDGDALRLAAKLRLLVGPNLASREPMVFAWAREQGGIAQYESSATDPCAATRRAIVRAAAEIGRAQP